MRPPPADPDPGPGDPDPTREAGPAAGDDDGIVLRDPRAIRALAHPARMTVLHRLLAGEVLTATECAESVGLTPSAMSYHLRALQRWGLIDRAEPSGDGRERPWRALGRTLRIEAENSPAGQAAGGLLLDQILIVMRTEVMANHEQRSRGLAGANPAFITHSPAYLTDAEARELYRSIDALIQPYSDRTRRPASGVRRHHLWVAGVPAEGVAAEPAAPEPGQQASPGPGSARSPEGAAARAPEGTRAAERP